MINFATMHFCHRRSMLMFKGPFALNKAPMERLIRCGKMEHRELESTFKWNRSGSVSPCQRGSVRATRQWLVPSSHLRMSSPSHRGTDRCCRLRMKRDGLWSAGHSSLTNTLCKRHPWHKEIESVYWERTWRIKTQVPRDKAWLVYKKNKKYS